MLANAAKCCQMLSYVQNRYHMLTQVCIFAISLAWQLYRETTKGFLTIKNAEEGGKRRCTKSHGGSARSIFSSMSSRILRSFSISLAHLRKVAAQLNHKYVLPLCYCIIICISKMCFLLNLCWCASSSRSFTGSEYDTSTLLVDQFENV